MNNPYAEVTFGAVVVLTVASLFVGAIVLLLVTLWRTRRQRR